jgi:hypothetical protein
MSFSSLKMATLPPFDVDDWVKIRHLQSGTENIGQVTQTWWEDGMWGVEVHALDDDQNLGDDYPDDDIPRGDVHQFMFELDPTSSQQITVCGWSIELADVNSL